MEFSISKNALQKELGFMQGIVERKNTIPVLSNILIESVGEGTLRLIGTDLDVTIRCETEADIKTPGSMCVQARKLFDIARSSEQQIRADEIPGGGLQIFHRPHDLRDHAGRVALHALRRKIHAR